MATNILIPVVNMKNFIKILLSSYCKASTAEVVKASINIDLGTSSTTHKTFQNGYFQLLDHLLFILNSWTQCSQVFSNLNNSTILCPSTSSIVVFFLLSVVRPTAKESLVIFVVSRLPCVFLGPAAGCAFKGAESLISQICEEIAPA